MARKTPQRKARPPVRKPVSHTPPWLAPVATLGGLAVIIVAFLAYRYFTTPPPVPPANQATTAQVIAAITSLPASEFDQVGEGSAAKVLKKVSDQQLKDASGKPLVFYFGAEYCPYCAAERWPVIVALSRFGTFSGLATTTSSSTDVFPNTRTFTFHTAKYTSDLIAFQSVEASDRDGNGLQSPSAAQQALITKYDQADTIPFLDIGNGYVLLQPSFSPDAITGMSWSDIATALANPESSQAQAIVGSANQLTAAICTVTSNQPATVCTAPIQAIEGKL